MWVLIAIIIAVGIPYLLGCIIEHVAWVQCWRCDCLYNPHERNYCPRCNAPHMPKDDHEHE